MVDSTTVKTLLASLVLVSLTMPAHAGWILKGEALVNTNSNLCLGANFNSTDGNGFGVQLSECQGKENQHWILEGDVLFNVDSDLCLGTDRANLVKGNEIAVRLTDCNDQLNQTLVFEGDAILDINSKRCLEVDRKSSINNNGLMVLLGECNGDDDPILANPEFVLSSNFPHDVTDIKTPYPDVTFDNLAKFAWNEFVALNYPADPNHRGQPLANSKLGDSADARVWESYWHRVEVFPYDGKPVHKGGKAVVTGKPTYRYSPAALNLDAKTFHSNSTSHINPTILENYKQLWNNLDEDSELDIDEMFGRVLTIADFTDENRILYEAKMNEVGFNYILENQLEHLSTRNTFLAAGKSKLQNNGSKCKPISGQVVLPCGSNLGGEGHVEIKAAWRALTKAEMTSNKFYTRKVIHYKAVTEKKKTENKWLVDTYGLIGLHIIHKTVNFPSFTYATFEHVDNIGNPSLKKATIGYIDQITQKGRGKGDKFDDKVIITKRDNPIPGPVAAVNTIAQKALAGTVWQNYQLTGVQAYPSDMKTIRSAASANKSNVNDNSSFFLANIVIESNEELQNFTGKQPGTSKDKKNTWFKGKNVNMGGCMGCHGVAQSKGADFSFLIANAPFTAPEVVGAIIGNITPFPINSYKDVLKMFNTYIMDNPINIEGSPHGPFWNQKKGKGTDAHKEYINFTTGKAYGFKIVECGTNKSNLITLLQGGDLPNITPKNQPGRMPFGGPYFPKIQIDNLEKWIVGGCNEFPVPKKMPPTKEPGLNELLNQGVKSITNYACQTLEGVRNTCGSDYISKVCPKIREKQCATSCNCYNCALPTTVGKGNSSYPSDEYQQYSQCQ